MKPITREEQYLTRLAGESEQTIPEPITRKEQYLSRLCGADNVIPEEPITREEVFLANLCGEEVTAPEPITRVEKYMAFASGESETKPEEPITRVEMLWDKYEGGEVSEEKTVGYSDIISITDALAKPAVSLKVAIEPVQEGSGDPSPDNVRPISGFDEVSVYVGETYSEEDARTYTVSLASAGTVYGGTLDVVSGELVVDRAMVDMGTLDWITYSAPERHVFRSKHPNPLPHIYDSETIPHAICSSYYPMPYTPIGSSDNGAFSISYNRVVVIDHRFTDASSFATAVYGVQLCYEIATPQTYQLTPTEVQMLLGNNTVWSDAGQVQLTYKAKAAEKVKAMNASLASNKLQLQMLKSGTISKPSTELKL